VTSTGEFAEAIDRITVSELRRRGGVKWSDSGPGVLGAFIAEMDFGTAPEVEAAFSDVIRRKDYGYLSDQTVAEMSQACADWQRSAYGWEVDPTWVMPLPDVLKGLQATADLFSRPGSPLIVPTPAYMPFLYMPRYFGRDIIQVPMVTDEKGSLVMDIAGLEKAFSAGGHLLILCNPCNPVGRVYTRSELAVIAAVVERHSGRVFADEIHAPLVYPGRRHVPYASVSATAAAHSVTATSVSKGWNLPGMKCAQLIVSNDVDAATWARHGLLYELGVSTIGVRAATAAYRNGGAWLDDIVRYLDGSRSLISELLACHLPGVRYTKPEGTYLAWLDCRTLDLGVGPGEFFHQRAGVLATDGTEFGEAGRGYLRLNFATPRPILTEMIARMGAAVSAECAG
jgi:cystathionine beta-lyase